MFASATSSAASSLPPRAIPTDSLLATARRQLETMPVAGRGPGVRIPKGTRPIFAQEPRPGREPHLLAAEDDENIYIWRRQEDQHYPIPKRLLYDPTTRDLVQKVEAAAKRQGRHAVDVTADLVATLDRWQTSEDGLRAMDLLRPLSHQAKLSPVELVQEVCAYGEMLMLARTEAMLRGMSTATFLQAAIAFYCEHHPAPAAPPATR